MISISSIPKSEMLNDFGVFPPIPVRWVAEGGKAPPLSPGQVFDETQELADFVGYY